MANKTFKARAGFILLAAFVPVLFALLFSTEFSQLMGARPDFYIPTLVGYAVGIYGVFSTFKFKEALSYNAWFYATAVWFVFLSIWIGAWCAALRWEVIS